MTDADKYQRAIELASRARTLERELTETKTELLKLADEISRDAMGATGSPAPSGQKTAAFVTARSAAAAILSDEPTAGLSKRAFAYYKRFPGKPMAAEEVGAALGIAAKDTKQLNLLRQYLSRLKERGELKRVERGLYVFSGK